MKVALIGNMNNNHFSLMRYLRDLGIDAYLIRYAGDKDGSNSHFTPDTDTWYIETWEKYIIESKLPISGIPALKVLLLHSGYIKELFKNYDIIIGNGFAPGYLSLTKRNLDIFLPYHVGGEFLKYSWISSFKGYIIHTFLIFFQVIGLKKTKIIGTSDQSKENLKYFKFFRLKTTLLEIPMVYNQEKVNITCVNLSDKVKNAIYLMSEYEFVIFSHVSHIWKNLPPSYPPIKRNDILIKGFAQYVRLRKIEKVRLFLVDYGHDVSCSKELINDLNINEYVIWLPVMNRKEIMFLLQYVNVGAGEFGGYLWGGTGWEFMSKGIPFFQYVTNLDGYMEKLKRPIPEIINVGTPEQIAYHLLEYENNPDFYKKKGIRLKEWFDTYNGINLSKKYIDIMLNIAK